MLVATRRSSNWPLSRLYLRLHCDQADSILLRAQQQATGLRQVAALENKGLGLRQAKSSLILSTGCTMIAVPLKASAPLVLTVQTHTLTSWRLRVISWDS